MNGRIYDPTLGRFLQADPFIQAPKDSQSFNRYAYVRNNPLSLTDPSGYSWLSKTWGKVKKYASVIVGAALIYFTGGTASWFVSSWYGAAAAGAIAGGVGAGVNGGNILTGALRGGISAAAFYGVGSAFSEAACASCFSGGELTAAATLGKIAAHAMTGGVMSVMQGGKFGHGFAAAGVMQGFAKSIDSISSARFSVGRIAAAAVVGGTASKLSGGKFANGAATGAFSRMFNDEGHWKAKVQAAANWAKTNSSRIITTVGGAAQVATGAALCTTGLGCIAGAAMVAHGANNIYEGVTGNDGVLRDGYQAASEFATGDASYGDMAYGTIDVGMSLSGATKLVLKPDSWKLFRNIPTDYTRAFTLTTTPALISNSVIDVNTIYDTYNKAGN